MKLTVVWSPYAFQVERFTILAVFISLTFRPRIFMILVREFIAYLPFFCLPGADDSPVWTSWYMVFTMPSSFLKLTKYSTFRLQTLKFYLLSILIKNELLAVFLLDDAPICLYLFFL